VTGRRIRRGLAVLAVVGLVGGGYAAYAASGDGASYRTATATVGDVERTLALAGTIEPSGRADLQFGTSGTVAAVPVAEGDRVRAGQVLARLDRTSLSTAVTKARAQLTAAQAQLETDEDAQADTVGSAVDTSSGDESQQPAQQSTPSSQPTQQPSPSSKPDPVLAELAKQQKAVTTAQSAASAAITAARTALTAQTNACQDAYAEPSADPTTNPSADPTTNPSADPTTTPTEKADPADEACATALTAVQTAQDTVAGAQDDLQGALTDLADTLTTALRKLNESQPKSAGQSAGPSSSAPSAAPTTRTPTATTSTPTTPSASSQGQGQGQSQTVTAATLARDQASIDQARAELVAAKQSLRAATVRAPHAGRVASISAVVGASVSAGDAAATVIAPGLTTVELAVTDTQVRQLKVGQTADATPAGARSALTGKVTAIGAVPDTSSGGTTYAVTVTLDQRDLGLPSGVTASVAVVVGTAKDVVTVPASAVRSGSVTVLDGETATRNRVTTGVVGTSLIEVTAGLTAGDRVVLADLGAAVPTSGSTTNGRTGGFGQGFGGGTGGPGDGQRSFSR
jgi:HlyD family secretion protein